MPYIRERSLGGSDIGIILGLNPYKSEATLYDEITTATGEVPEEQEESWNIRRGKLFEPVALRLYNQETGRGAVPCTRRYCREHAFMHASMDAMIFAPEKVMVAETVEERECAIAGCGEYALRPWEDGPGVLEIKCPTSRNWKIARDEGIHAMYYAQLQHYLYVTDFKWGAFNLFNAEECKVYYFDVERDEEYIERMVEQAVIWWERHIVRGVRPDERERAPTGEFWPRARVGAEGIVVDANQGESYTVWSMALLRLRGAREALALAKRNEAQAEAEIKALMQERDLVSVAGVGRVLWKEGFRATFDRGLLETARPLDREKVISMLRAIEREDLLPVVEGCALDMQRFVQNNVTRTFRPTFHD